jgi:hypothetical protein
LKRLQFSFEKCLVTSLKRGVNETGYSTLGTDLNKKIPLPLKRFALQHHSPAKSGSGNGK